MKNIFAEPKDNEQGLKTRSVKWGRAQRQEDGEFEGNVIYMEGLVFHVEQYKKRKKEGKKEGWKEKKGEKEGSEGGRKERKPWAHTYSKLW